MAPNEGVAIAEAGRGYAGWTREKAVEFLLGVPLRFTHYNKHVFDFKGQKNGYQIEARIGGDIYRLEVDADEPLVFGKGVALRDFNEVYIKLAGDILFEYVSWG